MIRESIVKDSTSSAIAHADHNIKFHLYDSNGSTGITIADIIAGQKNQCFTEIELWTVWLPATQ